MSIKASRELGRSFAGGNEPAKDDGGPGGQRETQGEGQTTKEGTREQDRSRGRRSDGKRNSREEVKASRGAELEGRRPAEYVETTRATPAPVDKETRRRGR